jgi:2-amino-4-hydroxy-6-hydroxymethyldihydropteridine diphosphokinase
MKYYLGLGTNIGKRLSNLERCLSALERSEIIIKNRSSIYETQPKGIQNQPWFLNQVVEVETEFSPDDLLMEIKKIEDNIGRKPNERNGPRIIDIDILLAGDKIVTTKKLKIPHPKLLERNFALVPLVEIAPDAVHPIAKKRIKELSEECADKAVVRIFRLYRQPFPG